MIDYEREFTPDMGEIGGFGGEYEAACKRMLFAGLRWCDDHPKADLRFYGLNSICAGGSFYRRETRFPSE